MPTPLPDNVSATLRTDPTAALGALMVITSAHAELFNWVARMVCEPHGVRPPGPVKASTNTQPKPNGSAAHLALSNGAEAARPFAPAGQGPRHPAAVAAAEAEARILELLKGRPGMKTSEVAAATSSKVNTTVERLKRMKTKGLIDRPNGGAVWQATGPPI